MDIKEKAKQFAINAHKNQVRKSEKEKPLIIHPINAAQILEEYSFDDNVVASAYLHDVVEDTEYKLSDILDNFNEDISSLVEGATEKDKTLSWEERKKETIERVKKLDLRHKAVVCADKISNLEDIQIMIERVDNYSFDGFKRGFDSQKWYYENIYQSLIKNEDKNHPMFVRLKKLIDEVYEGKLDDKYIENIIFENREDEYKRLKKINFRNKEIKKLNSVQKNKYPYIIEFTGTPRTGKTTLINNLYDLLKKEGLSVKIIEEFTTSEKYKKEIKPKLKDDYKNIVEHIIPENIELNIDNALKENYDIIIVDRGLFDRMIWADRMYLKDKTTKYDYNNYIHKYTNKLKEKENIIISLHTDSKTAIRRDYLNNLSLYPRTFLNETNLDEYNKSLKNITKLIKEENINIYNVNTTNKSQREISFDVVEEIHKNMREFYINKLNNDYNN